MKSREKSAEEAAAATQLRAENDGLSQCHLPEAIRAMLPEPPAAARHITEQVWAILNDPRLVPLLLILEQHNRVLRTEPGRWTPSKRSFLLGPHLYEVLASVQARNEMRQRLPVLDQQAAEVRRDLGDVAKRCRTLAKLIRKGPEPTVALAGKTSANEALKLFAPLEKLFEARDGAERELVALTVLMDRAADWFDGLSAQVPRATQNRHTGRNVLRIRASEFLPAIFRKRLGRPYHVHVATIATIVSGIETDADFVKKVEQNGSKQRQDGETLPRKKAETLP